MRRGAPTGKRAAKTRLVLADDHAVVRQALRMLIERDPRLAVVGEARDGLEAVSLVERLRPHVLVLDLLMPGLGGIDVARDVTRRWPMTRVVVLSMLSDNASVVGALRNGASAYVLKDATSEHLLRGIEEALAGRRYLSPPLSEKAVAAFLSRASAGQVDAYDILTRREREVLHLAAEGLSNPAIGRRLGISPRTAETHRAHLMAKLGLRSRAALVAYALKKGLLPSGGPAG